MTSKLVFAVGFGGLLVAALLLSSNKQSPVAERPEIINSHESVVATNSIFLPQKTSQVELVALNEPAKKTDVSTNFLEEQIIELTELGAGSDAGSLQKIIARLTDSHPEIREAALEATLQFGSRDVIPILEELAMNTTNVEEKAKFVEAAKFLALPTFHQIREQRRTNLNSKAISTSRN